MPDPTFGLFVLDLQGVELTPEEREWLAHPRVAGVILFARNYRDPAQVKALIAAIRRAAKRPILIGVDQEGGRVQRFRQGFTRLPPAAKFGALYRQDPKQARVAAEAAGFLMAAELLAVDVDVSFAPVLDIDSGCSEVIGDRAFADEPAAVAELAGAFARGMRRAGMAAVGKHFPGHGGVAEDSHLSLPEDGRSLAELEGRDLVPFQRLMGEGLEAVMCAHVRYPQVDDQPAGFSPVWIRDILRQRMRFEGAVLSDDLTMAGAAWAGDLEARAQAAFEAGCDLLLVCNCPEDGPRLLDRIRRQEVEHGERLRRLQWRRLQLSLEALAEARRMVEIVSE